MLSGGQKQRVAIARSIISNPRVLLLDEATSALDPNAEHIVQKALNNVAANRTMVVIAHRLSTIRDADNIVVMSKGTIIEHGTHNELIESGGAYSRLVLAQDLGQEGGRGDAEGETKMEGNDDQMALTQNQSSNVGHSAKQARAPAINYNLLKCVALIIKEQRSLWFPSAVICVTAIIGGMSIPSSTSKNYTHP
jgi:ATP-binding cassette subfamily B (MDR/TAP) protein 1